MIVAVTGHRPNRLGDEWNHDGPYSDYIRTRMIEIIKVLSPDKIISGMALGADLLWARMSRKFDIPLIATVPFRGQENRWSMDHIDEYRSILGRDTTELIITSEMEPGLVFKHRSEMYKHRDRTTVDKCQILVAVMSDPRSGTGYTVKYAEKQDKPVIFINPEGWRK